MAAIWGREAWGRIFFSRRKFFFSFSDGGATTAARHKKEERNSLKKSRFVPSPSSSPPRRKFPHQGFSFPSSFSSSKIWQTRHNLESPTFLLPQQKLTSQARPWAHCLSTFISRWNAICVFPHMQRDIFRVVLKAVRLKWKLQVASVQCMQ